MKPLPYPDMPADSRAIARLLIEPILDAALERNDIQAATYVLTTLADVDPLGGVNIPALPLDNGDSVVVDSIGPLESTLYVAISGMVND